MGSSKGPEPAELTKTVSEQIKAEVKQAAIDHLNVKDAPTALSHFTEDAIAVSNTILFPSLLELAEDVNAYYDILKEVNLAVWDEMHIKVIDADAALFTAKFRYSFTDTNDQKTNLTGVWTALYVRCNGQWKIQARHESFAPVEK